MLDVQWPRSHEGHHNRIAARRVFLGILNVLLLRASRRLAAGSPKASAGQPRGW